jgi:hypothetical protein
MNRCIPCTVLNVFIASVIAGLLVGIGLFWIAITTFVACIVVIYLHGYLIPGTPTITERYFSKRVLRLFGKDLPNEHTHDLHETTDDTAEERESVEALVATGIVTRRGDEIDLSSDFRDAWHERIHAIRERERERDQDQEQDLNQELEPRLADVQTIYGADTITRHGPASFVVDKNKSVRWVSEAALVADVASATELENRLDAWKTFSKSRRDEILTGLRLFLRYCPACDGPLSVEEDRVDPCCQKAHIVVQSACERCDVLIVETAVVDTGEDVSTRLRFLRS